MPFVAKPGPSTRLVLADDHELVRSGLRALLESEGFEVVGEASSAEQAIAVTRDTQPDVVVADVSMGGMSGIDATPELLRVAVGCRVLLVTGHREPRILQRAFAAGATGFVPKDASPAELVEAARTVAAGEEYVHPDMRAVRGRGDEAFGLTLKGPGGELTNRELAVLREIAHGRTNAEAAEVLFLSVRTVENHRARVMQKLGVSSRADLVRLAITAGLVEGV